MKRFVNGPSSVTRLEKGNKVVYVFSDPIYHEEIVSQCSELGAIDIHTLLIQEAVKTGKTYDYFQPTEVDVGETLSNPESRDNFYSEIHKMLVKLGLSKNKHILGNGRVHIISLPDFIGLRIPYITSLLPQAEAVRDTTFVPAMQRDFRALQRELQTLIKLLKNPKAKYEKEASKTSITHVKNISKNIEKLLNAKDKSVQSDLKSQIDNAIENLTKAIDYLETASTKTSDLITKGKLYDTTLRPVEEIVRDLQAVITTSFILRRILDKDYINISIVYAIPRDCAILIHKLTKQYGFKVTHTTLKSYDKISAMIDQMDGLQCIDMSDFPDHLI